MQNNKKRLVEPKYYYQCPFCKQKAFLLYKKPIKGDILLAQKCIYENGKKPVTGEAVECGFCSLTIPKAFITIDRIFDYD